MKPRRCTCTVCSMFSVTATDAPQPRAPWNGLNGAFFLCNTNFRMPIINVREFFRSIRYAFRGLRYVYKHEQNFRIQLIAAVAVLLLIPIVGVTAQQAIVLVLVSVLVLVLEVLNTTLEKFVDLLKPRLHYLVEVIKDLMAAAVFLMSLVAVVIGALIFLPYFLPTR